eukprot:XP_014768194.1 PREDICTED: uncharacterized protein LOC106867744 isoform X2 [Octopus bimaculoides]
MTENSFKRSPIYLYWDKLPIEKVQFQLIDKWPTTVFIFNGTGTNSTSWFQKDKVLVNPLQDWDLQDLTFNENHPYFRIENSYQVTIEAKREIGNNEKYDIFLNVPSSFQNTYKALIISVLFN